MPIKLEKGNHQKKEDYTPTADTTAGSAVLFGTTVTITSVDIAANELGAVNWPNGGADYWVPNPDGTAFARGAEIFYDDANDKALTTGGVGKLGTVLDDSNGTDDVLFIHER